MTENPHQHDLYIVLGKSWKPFMPYGKAELTFESQISALAGGQMHTRNKESSVLFVTGKTAGTYQPSESTEMEALALKVYDIPPDKRFTSNMSFSTRTDAIAACEFMNRHKFNKSALITVHPHTIRARETFNKFGFELTRDDVFDSFSVMHFTYGKIVEEYKKTHTYIYAVLKEMLCLTLTKTIDPKGELLDSIAIRTRHRLV